MLTVDNFGKTPLTHRDDMSIREIARTFSQTRRKVCEILVNPQLKPYTRARSKAAPVLRSLLHSAIDAVLADDDTHHPSSAHRHATLPEAGRCRRLRPNPPQYRQALP